MCEGLKADEEYYEGLRGGRMKGWREMRIDGWILTFGLLPKVIVLA
jgi:hypothetical protein